jgi:hypothetical protein
MFIMDQATDFRMLPFIRSLRSKIYAIMDYLQEIVDLPDLAVPILMAEAWRLERLSKNLLSP